MGPACLTEAVSRAILASKEDFLMVRLIPFAVVLFFLVGTLLTRRRQ